MTLAEFVDRISGAAVVAQSEMYAHSGNPIKDFRVETGEDGEVYIQFEEEEL